ncbi:redoxin family protein [Pseudoflavitalea sp. X16]|uniref:redoxin family protein n=1 Tax=Paraflavitalea devenefica TaxID=2716334 RepID=UPI0014244955|nr:redoxin family protein [Paraflavitalea devenefica]NII27497.1 redoxin family protein [Paraflavitalea devenefica]
MILIKSCCLLLIIVLQIPFSNLMAQQKEMKVGDELPNLKFEVVNYKQPFITLSDFDEEIIVFDFWATWCGACISSFKKLDSLQRAYLGKIAFLPVSYESRKKVALHLGKINSINRTSFPSVVNDTVLMKLFPHSVIPHYVWVNKKGKILALTQTDQITASNIDRALQNQLVESISPKRILAIDYFNSPLFIPAIKHVNRSTKEEEISLVNLNGDVFRSIMTPYQEDYLNGFFGGGDDNRITVSNVDVRNLYVKAFENLLSEGAIAFMAGDKVVWELKDSSLNILNSHLFSKINKGNEVVFREWLKRYTFCYEIVTPASWGRNRKYEIMLNDLNNYFGLLFGIEGKLEKRKVDVYSLVSTGNRSALVQSKNENASLEHNRYFFNMNLNKVSVFVQLLNSLYQPDRILIDNTEIEEPISLSLNCDLRDFDAVKAALNRYKLSFVKKQVEQQLIVIRQVGRNNSKIDDLIDNRQARNGKGE